MEETLTGLVRNEADECTKWERKAAKSKGDRPLLTTHTGDLESIATDEANQDLNKNLCLETLAGPYGLEAKNRPMKVIAKKYQFFDMPSKTFNFLSKRRLLKELKICANTNALNTSVCTVNS